MSEQPEEPLTADAFRRTPATTQRVARIPVPQQEAGKAKEGPAPAAEDSAEAETAVEPAPAAVPVDPRQPGPANTSTVPLDVSGPAASVPAPEPAAPQQPYECGPATQQPAPEAFPPPFGQQPVQQPYGPMQFAPEAPRPSVVPPVAPATWGWRGRVRRMTGGLIQPSMGKAESSYRAALDQVQGHLMGPRTIVMVNPKGGATTTTSTLMAAHTFGVHRGGSTVAWDNNETRGTLGQRARPVQHQNTARELLDNLAMFEGAGARVGDLGLYLRSQGASHFDVLASDERPEVTGHIASTDVKSLHQLFERFYKIILIDTGNNMRAPNWLAAVAEADLLVVTTTVRQDSAQAATWMLNSLEKDVFGPGQLKERSITLLAEPSRDYNKRDRQFMVNEFSARTSGVLPIPYDPGLVDGGVINHDRLLPATHNAWLFACAAMVSVLQNQQRLL